MTDTMVTIVYTLWGLGRDGGGVLKPAQVIKIFPGEKQVRCDTEPHGLSVREQGWAVMACQREQGWAVGFCRWLGRSVQCYQTVIHTHCVCLFTPHTPE